MDTDRIEKQIELKAPVSRVWRALTDAQEFGEWFGVKMEGPFVVGKTARGRITYPGYEHLVMEVVVQKIEAEKLFLVHVASVCGRREERLFEGNTDAGGISAGEDGERDAAAGDGIRVRQDPEGAARGSVPEERRRVGTTGEKY